MDSKGPFNLTGGNLASTFSFKGIDNQTLINQYQSPHFNPIEAH